MAGGGDVGIWSERIELVALDRLRIAGDERADGGDRLLGARGGRDENALDRQPEPLEGRADQRRLAAASLIERPLVIPLAVLTPTS